MPAIPLAVSVIFILAVIVIVFIVIRSKPSKTHTSPPNIVESHERQKHAFVVYNYLTKFHISVQTRMPSGEVLDFIKDVPPLGNSSVPKGVVERQLVPGADLLIYIFESGQHANAEQTLFSSMKINTEADKRVKCLRVGMITTRFIGATDTLRETVTPANALGGSAVLKIHNLTYVPLSFNEGKVTVKPHDTLWYKGYVNMGVPLGSWFRNDNQIFPTFQYLQPQSDLYYGVVSDLQQPLQGPWQYNEFSDEIDAGQTLWPMQDGFY